MFSRRVRAGDAAMDKTKCDSGFKLKIEIPDLRYQIQTEAMMRLVVDEARLAVFARLIRER